MTPQQAIDYARMRTADLYKIEGFGESWDHSTLAEVLADEVERLGELVETMLAALELSVDDCMDAGSWEEFTARRDLARARMLEAIAAAKGEA